MRGIFRLVISVLGLGIGALYALTVETIATEWGWISFVKGGWRSLVEAGYADWVRWGTLFFAGGAAALWTDYGLRRLLERKSPTAATRASVWFRAGEEDRRELEYLGGNNIYTWEYFAQAELKFFVVFDREMKDGHISVATTANDLRWVEDRLSDRALSLTIKGQWAGATIMIEVRAASISSGRRQQPKVEQAAITFEPELMSNLLSRDTETERQP